jgi:hypothetical protein
MKMEFIVDGHLTGKDVGVTSAPQRFGMKTIANLQEFRYKLR